MGLMGRNETLSFTVGPETSSFNVSVLGMSSLFQERRRLLMGREAQFRKRHRNWGS